MSLLKCLFLNIFNIFEKIVNNNSFVQKSCLELILAKGGKLLVFFNMSNVNLMESWKVDGFYLIVIDLLQLIAVSL